MRKNFLIVFLMSLFALLSTKTFGSEECRLQVVEVAKMYRITLEPESFSQFDSISELLLTPEEFNNLTVLEQEVYYELLRPLSSVVAEYKALLNGSIQDIFEIAIRSNAFEALSIYTKKYLDMEKALDLACKDI